VCQHRARGRTRQLSPLDRALALAASVKALSRLRCWLEARCGCGSCTLIPLRLLAEQGQAARTIADVLLRLRCRGCGQTPATVDLIECAGEQGVVAHGGRPAWRVALLARP
jgi:hypothetical protein